MKNGLVLLAVTLSVVSFGGMMRIKTDVQQMVRERQKLADQELQLKETKRVLEAEYAMLINPLRLTELAQARGYQELTMNRLMALSPHGISSTTVSGTSGGMTLAAVIQAAKQSSPSAVSRTVVSGTAAVSATARNQPVKVVPAAPVTDEGNAAAAKQDHESGPE